MTSRKRKPARNPHLLKTSIITTPYRVYCEVCGAKYGETSNPPFADAPPAICSLCKKAMREVAA